MKKTVKMKIEAVYTFDNETFSEKDVKSVDKQIRKWVMETLRYEASEIPFYIKRIEYTTDTGKIKEV
jgi:hypothetical protein